MIKSRDSRPINLEAADVGCLGEGLREMTLHCPLARCSAREIDLSRSGGAAAKCLYDNVRQDIFSARCVSSCFSLSRRADFDLEQSSIASTVRSTDAWSFRF